MSDPQQIGEEPVPVTSLRPNAPIQIESIIAKAMAKLLESRYEYAHEMAADLASLFGRMNRRVPPPSAQERYDSVRTLAKRLARTNARLAKALGADPKSTSDTIRL